MLSLSLLALSLSFSTYTTTIKTLIYIYAYKRKKQKRKTTTTNHTNKKTNTLFFIRFDYIMLCCSVIEKNTYTCTDEAEWKLLIEHDDQKGGSCSGEGKKHAHTHTNTHAQNTQKREPSSKEISYIASLFLSQRLVMPTPLLLSRHSRLRNECTAKKKNDVMWMERNRTDRRRPRGRSSLAKSDKIIFIDPEIPQLQPL